MYSLTTFHFSSFFFQIWSLLLYNTQWTTACHTHSVMLILFITLLGDISIHGADIISNYGIKCQNEVMWLLPVSSFPASLRGEYSLRFPKLLLDCSKLSRTKASLPFLLPLLTYHILSDTKASLPFTRPLLTYCKLSSTKTSLPFTMPLLTYTKLSNTLLCIITDH